MGIDQRESRAWCEIPEGSAGTCALSPAHGIADCAQSVPEWLRPIAGLAVATGMRRGEILGLR
jgi:hypothetical protein